MPKSRENAELETPGESPLEDSTRDEPELEELPEIQATLPLEGRTPGEVVPVRLASRVTEVGTLRLEAIPRDGTERWQVEFEVRES